MAGLVEKDFRLIWCNKQALIFLLIIGVVIGLQNEAVILGWLPFAISMLVAAGLYMILEMKQQMPVDMASQIPVVLVFLPVTALLIALLIPLQLVSGVEKSRVVISGTCGVMGASVIAFAELVKTNVLSAFSFLNQMNGWILAGIAVVVTVLLILLSYAISVRIMEKKEF